MGGLRLIAVFLRVREVWGGMGKILVNPELFEHGKKIELPEPGIIRGLEFMNELSVSVDESVRPAIQHRAYARRTGIKRAKEVGM